MENYTLKAATALVGTSTSRPLGEPSKMPGTSYGISAKHCVTGSKLAEIEGSVCFDCYALKGNYLYPSVQITHKRRLASLRGPEWPSAMAFLILRAGETYHRWRDSGDLQGEWHLDQIVKVCRLTRKVRHWLPTRELKIVQDYVAHGGTIPDNLTIRVSATMVDGPATKAWPTTSGVYDKRKPIGERCTAPDRNGVCGPCRACWDKSVPHVSYHKH